jgi:glycosyltransferase involved in cell wall biosynthesis
MTRRYSIAMLAACPLPYPRGTPIRIHRLANALAQRGNDVHVVAYHLGLRDDDTRYQLHRIPNVPTYRKVAPGPTYQKLLVLDPLLALRTRGLLRRIPFDVIHAHHYEGMLAALAGNRKRGVPIVFDVHTLLEAELPFYGLGLLPRIKRRVGRMLDTRVPPRANHVIAVTDTIKSKLLELGRLEARDISVIGSGVHWEEFAVPRERGLDLRPGLKTAIYTGNLAAYQGIDLMLRAFARLSGIREDVRLRIVTESSFAPYEELTKELGIGERLDVVQAPFSALPAHLAASSLALNPRVQCDGLPQKLLNYMAAAKPIVSFEGSAKLLVHEHNALIVPDADIDAFAQAMNRLCDDPGLGQRLGDTARDLVRTTMSWDAVAQQVESVYAGLRA